MYNYIKQRIEANLMDEIKNLSAGDLEYVGHYMISVIEGERLIHHGLNKYGKPVGYTVDTFSSNSEVVGEYTVDKDYFTDYTINGDDNYKKLCNDINHALKFSSVVRKIYLICSQEEIPSFRGNFAKMNIFIQNRDKIFIYDCREIAKTIYQQAKDNEEDAVFYKSFFPNFAQEFDNYEYYGKIPMSCDNYCKDSKILDKLDQFYKTHNICVLYGVSGSGKTQTAIEYVHYKRGEFQNYIWINGQDWKKDTSLSSISHSRGGASINVAGLFNHYKTILVIDNLDREIDDREFLELQNGFKKGGIILITSQLNNETDMYVQMPDLSEEVALNILGENNISDELVKAMIDKCKGIPIILSSTKKIIETENIDRNDLYREIIDNPNILTGPDSKSIIKKILSKLDDKMLEYLKMVANSGVTTYDIHFLRKFTSILVCRNLQQLSILMITNIPGIVKFHDLICTAMKEKSDPDKILKTLNSYIESKKGMMTPSILRQTYILSDLIYQYKQNNTEIDWLTYALLQLEGNEKNEIVKELSTNIFVKDMSLPKIMCLIEAKELAGYDIKDEDKLEQYYVNLIKEYQEATELYSDNDRKISLMHHLGKAYRRHREFEQSYKIFMEILKMDALFLPTYGQIVTLGTMKVPIEIRQAGELYIRKLFKLIFVDDLNIPLRITLTTIARLRSYKNIVNSIFDSEEKVDKVCKIVASAAIEDISQFFEGFLAISSIFGFHYSAKCISLVESVPDMIMVEPEIIENRQWINACEALANIAENVKEINHELYENLICKSIEFGEAYINKLQINSFGIRAVAKAYIVKGEYEKALKLINRIEIDNRDHWILYRQAQAEMYLQKIESVRTIQKALKLLEVDAKNSNRKPSYLHLLSKCYVAQGERDKSKLTIDEAIKICTDVKYKNLLIQYSNTI